MPKDLIPPALLAQIQDGKVVLVLGAGASHGACHPEGHTIPLGAQLGEQLAKQFLGGEHSTDALAVIAELAISETSLFNVQEFIREVFDPFRPAPFHSLLNTFKWHGVATLNYDLIIERSYSGKTFQTIRTVTNDNDRVEDLVRSPSDLLFLKLHGCITKTRDSSIPLILTADQYITHRTHRGQLYLILKNWARDSTLVFVGTTLHDFDLRQLLLEVDESAPSRSRFYFVTPEISEPMRRMWGSRSITMLQYTFEAFLKELDSAIPALARAVPVRSASLEVFARFRSHDPSLSEAARLFLEHDVEYIHTGLPSRPIDPATFYRGAGEGWAPIMQGLDCDRELCAEVLLDVLLADPSRPGVEVVPILAPAGAGKTILLRRICWEAATDTGAMCLWVKHTAILTGAVIEEIVSNLESRLYLFIDNAPARVVELVRICEMAERRNCNVTIMTTARTNEWNMACDELAPFVRQQFDVRPLGPTEVDGLLRLLEEHNALGTLETESEERRRSAFTDYAQGNLLVALHEATLGRAFEDIILDEYESIIPGIAQSVYLTLCMLNRTGTRVRAGLISRVHGISFERFQNKLHEPLEHLVYATTGKRGYDYEYHTRHPHIAELVFQQVLTIPQTKYEKYVSVLDAMVLSYETDRTSFQHMMNHKSLIETISDRGLIEQLFGLAKERAPGDGHIYLHHGLFELKQADPNYVRASELLDSASARLPNSEFVQHAQATLAIRMAESERRPLLREKHLREAKSRAKTLCGKHARSAHGYHALFRIELVRLKSLLDEEPPASHEAIASSIQTAEKTLSEGLQMFPDEVTMIASEAELAALLDDQDRIVKALEYATKKSLNNGNIVGRLSRHYERQGRLDDAYDLIRRALEVLQYDKKLHYQLGRLIIDRDGDPSLIESHLRSAFANGDRNYEAQYWYARQLYLNGKIELARERFGILKSARVAPKVLRTIRGHWKEGGDAKLFSGATERIEMNHAFITRDGTGDSIYTDRRASPGDWWDRAQVGGRVRFGMAFKYAGPVAVSVEVE